MARRFDGDTDWLYKLSRHLRLAQQGPCDVLPGSLKFDDVDMFLSKLNDHRIIQFSFPCISLLDDAHQEQVCITLNNSSERLKVTRAVLSPSTTLTTVMFMEEYGMEVRAPELLDEAVEFCHNLRNNDNIKHVHIDSAFGEVWDQSLVVQLIGSSLVELSLQLADLYPTPTLTMALARHQTIRVLSLHFEHWFTPDFFRDLMEPDGGKLDVPWTESNCSLDTLVLKWNYVLAFIKDAESVARMLEKNPRITTLLIECLDTEHYWEDWPKVGRYLEKALSVNTNLQKLGLELGRADADTIHSVVHPMTPDSDGKQANSTLRSLALASNWWEKSGLREVAKMLTTNTTLVRLELKSLGPKPPRVEGGVPKEVDVVHLLDDICLNKSLQALSLRGWRVVRGEAVFAALMKLLRANPWLVELDLKGTGFKQKGMYEAIKAQLQENKERKLLDEKVLVALKDLNFKDNALRGPSSSTSPANKVSSNTQSNDLQVARNEFFVEGHGQISEMLSLEQPHLVRSSSSTSVKDFDRGSEESSDIALQGLDYVGVRAQSTVKELQVATKDFNMELRSGGASLPTSSTSASFNSYVKLFDPAAEGDEEVFVGGFEHLGSERVSLERFHSQCESGSPSTFVSKEFKEATFQKGLDQVSLFSRFTIQELQVATKDFTMELGAGGFGKVFEGVLSNGIKIAVKVLTLSDDQSKKSFSTEMQTLGSIRHVNLVHLLGYCIEDLQHMLIYEFMPNSSLDKWLFSQKPERFLDWEARIGIAVGIARGLLYLHRDCNPKIIHLDIKPENILLDANLAPKLADFGLARLMDMGQTRVFLSVGQGTLGYMAPEVCTALHVSEKSDVYSYGLLLMEIIRGKKNWNPHKDEGKCFFPGWAMEKMHQSRVADILKEFNTSLPGFQLEQARKLMRISLLCFQMEMEKRPDMSSVLQMLEGHMKIPKLPRTSKFLRALGF